MAERLTWEEIERLYDQEWVELVDYDWPDAEANSDVGVVEVHAKSRRCGRPTGIPALKERMRGSLVL